MHLGLYLSSRKATRNELAQPDVMTLVTYQKGSEKYLNVQIVG